MRKYLLFALLIFSVLVIYTCYYGNYSKFPRLKQIYPPKILKNDFNQDNETNSAYLVNTQSCQIISWPILDSDVRPLYKNRTKHTIGCGKPLNISIERIKFIAIIVKNLLNKTLQCLVQSIRRKDSSDKKILFTPEVKINLDQVYNFSHEIAVKVKCANEQDKEVIEKVVPLIPDLMSDTNKSIDNSIPNVLLLGIDSVSRLNFERHFPLAKEFISKHNFYTMYGYNKVGDNTFPNLTPLLTGHYVEDIWNEKEKRHFDYFPFIWKEYKKKGFLTFYMEDAPNMNTFNYEKIGFANPPTDYYLRPFFKAMDKRTKGYCYLDEPEVKVYYDYLYDFVKAMKEKNNKYIALHFMARLTHDVLNDAGLMDPFVTNLLKRLFSDNLMTNTILVFFSDHGLRFGAIRGTLSGKYEERLPFMHIYVPKEWRNKNISINQNRLTSPFDIHATLKHIINGSPDSSLRYGKTLLEEIPEDRSCKSIPISDHWCGCQTSIAIKDLTPIKPMAEFIVKEVNLLLTKESQKCVELSLGKTLSAFEQRLNDKVLRFKTCKTTSDLCLNSAVFRNTSIESQSKHYLITIEVKPSNALFEATVNYNTKSSEMSLIGDISRINLYGNQSHCIESAFLRKYCFCEDIYNKSI